MGEALLGVMEPRLSRRSPKGLDALGYVRGSVLPGAPPC